MKISQKIKAFLKPEKPPKAQTEATEKSPCLYSPKAKKTTEQKPSRAASDSSPALFKLPKQIVSVVLALVLLFSTVTPALADWVVDGSSSTTSSGGITKNTSYSIEHFDDNKNIVAVRFSVYNKYSGETKGTTIDVFKDPSAMSYQKFSSKLNKMQLKQIYDKTKFTTTSSNAGCYTASAVKGKGKLLPSKFSEIKTWENSQDNFSGILKAMGIDGVYKTTDLDPGDCILAEPMFRIKVKNQKSILTVSEMAIVGYRATGSGWNDTAASSSTPNSWGFISHYTNGYFPSAMYLDDTKYLGDDLPVGQPVKKINDRPIHRSFYDMVNCGYGIHVCYGNDEPEIPPWKPPEVTTNA